MTPDMVIAAGAPSTLALDGATGRLRWSTDDNATALAIGAAMLFFGNDHGGIGTRSLATGSIGWHHASICAPQIYDAAGRVTLLKLFGPDLIVGCEGGRVVRIDARTGAIRARSDRFSTYVIQEIDRLGSCSFGVSGYSDGAHVTQRSAIFGCHDLNAIHVGGTDTSILGSVGEVAFMNDMCCNGRGGLPARVYRVHLQMGGTEPEVELIPEPKRYPPASRQLGDDQAVAVIGPNLYLGVGHSLYRYPDVAVWPLGSRPAERLADDLAALPQFLAGGAIALSTLNAHGPNRLLVVRSRGTELEPIIDVSEQPSKMLGYDRTRLPDVLSLNRDGQQMYFRIADGERLTISGPCQAEASDRRLLVVICNLPTLVRSRNLQELKVYRWP